LVGVRGGGKGVRTNQSPSRPKNHLRSEKKERARKTRLQVRRGLGRMYQILERWANSHTKMRGAGDPRLWEKNVMNQLTPDRLRSEKISGLEGRKIAIEDLSQTTKRRRGRL